MENSRGRPELSGELKENPLDTISRETKEETGIVTLDPKVEDIFLIQELKNRKGNCYYAIAFDLSIIREKLKKEKK